LRATETSAIRCDGTYRLTGEKAYVSNLPFANFVIVIARTEPGERKGSGRSLSAFAVPSDSQGFRPGPRRDTLGLRSLAVGSLSLHDVVVPESLVIGDEGAGLSLLNSALDLSRVMMASYGVGASRRVVSDLLQRGRHARPDGTKPSRQQSYRLMLADMHAEVSAARALAWVAATRHDARLPYTTEASVAKLYAGRMSRRISERAGGLLEADEVDGLAAVDKFRREVPALAIIEGSEPIQSEIVYAELLRRGVS
jgi:alkylation response protein AidB-like acyl-CoA dehydrogenase